ncbi:hypothetical protein BpHYR1_054000 [Brachionus plicatilis]|uniref:Uncharacterized protein n=1 Tax=Brachionus plicatilis TaxID=10195 RepID=A0A3M7S5S5_BRAPC|nr:hypothetical protein BpHYR1_054000 [Brachionus plicatilis]
MRLGLGKCNRNLWFCEIQYKSCISYQSLQNSANLAELRFQYVQAHLTIFILLLIAKTTNKKLENNFSYSSYKFIINLVLKLIVIRFINFGCQIMEINLVLIK